MQPSELQGIECAPRESAEMCMWRNIRARLQVIANNVGMDGEVYINGQTLNANHFRFLLENFQPPKKTK